jgi:hypothetical protein
MIQEARDSERERKHPQGFASKTLTKPLTDGIVRSAVKTMDLKSVKAEYSNDRRLRTLLDLYNNLSLCAIVMGVHDLIPGIKLGEGILRKELLFNMDKTSCLLEGGDVACVYVCADTRKEL